jgi:hypothetical protein
MAADGANAFRGALGRIGWSVPAANAFTNEGFDPFTSVSQAISIVSPTPLPLSEHDIFSHVLSNTRYIIVSGDFMQ